MWRERQAVRWERTVGRSVGDNPVCDGFEQGGLCAVWWKGLLVARPMAHNVWCYKQVCVAPAANLLIARVMLSLRFINEKLKSKHRSSIYFFVRWQKLI